MVENVQKLKNKKYDPRHLIRLIVVHVSTLSFGRLTELMLMLAVVWLSGEGLLAVAVPVETGVGKAMSWMP